MDRNEKGQFVKGHECLSRDGGRPKGLAEYARAQTLDGKKLIDWLVTTFETHRDVRIRLDACDRLLDRGWGKPVQFNDNTNRHEVIMLDWGEDGSDSA